MSGHRNFHIQFQITPARWSSPQKDKDELPSVRYRHNRVTLSWERGHRCTQWRPLGCVGVKDMHFIRASPSHALLIALFAKDIYCGDGATVVTNRDLGCIPRRTVPYIIYFPSMNIKLGSNHPCGAICGTDGKRAPMRHESKGLHARGDGVCPDTLTGCQQHESATVKSGCVKRRWESGRADLKSLPCSKQLIEFTFVVQSIPPNTYIFLSIIPVTCPGEDTALSDKQRWLLWKTVLTGARTRTRPLSLHLAPSHELSPLHNSARFLQHCVRSNRAGKLHLLTDQAGSGPRSGNW
jgi:hypothetical protein